MKVSEREENGFREPISHWRTRNWKEEPKSGNQNEPKNWRTRKVFPLSGERNTKGITVKHRDPLGPSVEVKLLPGNCSKKNNS